VIVGGGVTGTVCAIELARAGQAVTLIEADHIGSGATGRSLGVLSTPAAGAGFGDPDALVHGRPLRNWHRDRLAAQRYLLRLVDESGWDCDLGAGVVLLAPTAKNFAMLERTVEARNAYYGTSDYAVTADRLDTEAGGRAAEHFAGALVMADAHTIQPAKMMAGLASLARGLGARICERTAVVGLERNAAGHRVLTNGGETLARDVLVATGGYTGGVQPFLQQRTLGLPSIASASEELPEDEVRDVFRSGRALLVNRHCGYSCRPTPDGRRIILGGPVGQVPRTPAENAERLHAWFTRLFPDLAGIEFTHCWAGLIAATRDGQGHEGAHDGTWYAVGGSGIVSCADAGRRMAQHILHHDVAAATVDARFARWPLRDHEQLWWRAIEWYARSLDLVGRSRLR